MHNRVQTHAAAKSWVRLFAGFFVLLLINPAVAQGFLVKPMRVEVAPPAGRLIEIPLEIRNTGNTDVRQINLRLVDVSQGPDGAWQLIEPADESGSPERSSIAWTELNADSVDIAPMEPAEVTVRVRPPITAKGFYFAGIVAETPLPEITQGIAVRTRFLIPVIVQIPGRPVRQQVDLGDLSMTYQPPGGGPPTTIAGMSIVNKGGTFSRVRGQMQVERQNGDKWRPVTRFDIPERSIMPGLTLTLGQDLQRRLPSGTYRLRGDLFVDGRRVKPLEKEIAFEGDPSVDTLAYDTALLLNPPMVDMKVAPGATRTTVVEVENPGTDPVNVDIAMTTPRSLIGVEMGELKGAELSAEPWTVVRPAQFTLRPGRRQNVRVMSRVPREGLTHPNYYADLVLKGAYADGQSAGETKSTIHLLNAKMTALVDGTIDQLSVAEGEDAARYVVQSRLTNIGDVHVEPTIRVELKTSQDQLVRNETLIGDEGPLLPLAKRTYSAVVDFSGVEPGYYALRAVASLADDREVAKQQVVLVQRAEDPEGGAGAVHVSVVESATIEEQQATDAASGDNDASSATEGDAPLVR
jgi:hypothetical protein